MNTLEVLNMNTHMKGLLQRRYNDHENTVMGRTLSDKR